MFRYLIIESVDSLKTYEETLIAFFTDMMHINHVDKNEHQLILYFRGDYNVTFSDIIVNLSSDILSDIRLFESYKFKTERERDINKQGMLHLLSKIAIAKYAFLNEEIVLKTLIHHIEKTDHPCFLKVYMYDRVMLNSIKIYLESNQNTSYAAKQLFIHRNTLIQRIDKFIDVTGFDIRKFVPGYLIYSLLHK